MKYAVVHHSVIEIFSILSLMLFLITSDYLTIPLFLAFIVTIFTDITFINVSFGLALFAFFISMITGKGKSQVFFKIAYIILSITCVGAMFLARPKMFVEIPTLISAILFMAFIILMIWKWSSKIAMYLRRSMSGDEL